MCGSIPWARIYLINLPLLCPRFTETTDHRRNFRNPTEFAGKDMGPVSTKEAIGRGGIDATILFNHGPNWLINDKVMPSAIGLLVYFKLQSKG